MRHKLATFFYSWILFSGICLLGVSASTASSAEEVAFAQASGYELLCYRAADGPEQSGDIRNIKVSYKKFRSINERNELISGGYSSSSFQQKIQSAKEVSLASYVQPSVSDGDLFIRYEVFRI